MAVFWVFFMQVVVGTVFCAELVPIVMVQHVLYMLTGLPFVGERQKDALSKEPK